MDPGRFSHRITIEHRAVVGRAPNGEEIIDWTPRLEAWAAVDPLRGREYFAAAQTQIATDYRITIRYRAGITRDMRIVWRGQPLDIASDPAGCGPYLELMCISGVRNGR